MKKKERKRYMFLSKNKTLLRYFLSYFIILNILFWGFFIGVRFQFEHAYLSEIKEQNNSRIESMSNQFETNFGTLNQINSYLQNDISIIQARHTNDNWDIYQAYSIIEKYTLGNNFIDTVCYLDYTNQNVLSSRKNVVLTPNGCKIYVDGHYLDLNLKKYEHSTKNVLLSIHDKTSKLLIYLPQQGLITSSRFFFVLSDSEVQNLLMTGASDTANSVFLMDGNKNLLSGYNTDKFNHDYSSLSLKDGPHKLDKDESYDVRSELTGNYSVVSISSNKLLINQVNIAFRNIYIILLAIFVLGLIFIVVAMSLTYLPLRRLIYKLIPTVTEDEGYLTQLDSSFTVAETKNLQLQTKIDSYHQLMQKTIFSSIITEGNNSDNTKALDIDSFFCLSDDTYIYIVVVEKKEQSLSSTLKQFLNENLSGNCYYTILKDDADDEIVLLRCSGDESENNIYIQSIFMDFYKKTRNRAAISSPSKSPLEIPALYEKAMDAKDYWNRECISMYTDVFDTEDLKTDFDYPHKELEELTALLAKENFPEVENCIEALFDMLDESTTAETPFPEFFTRCVLIDILTFIIHSMNDLNIRFKDFSDLYFETLFLCRSCPYTMNRNKILTNIGKLLSQYEEKCTDATIPTAQVEKILNEEYTSADFSIQLLADHFHVSVAYMSYVFKKSFDENFSTYLWNLRVNKAIELMRNTDMTIDSISIAVGYVNTSSFRRKFKNETGLTPSQYRNKPKEDFNVVKPNNKIAMR